METNKFRHIKQEYYTHPYFNENIYHNNDCIIIYEDPKENFNVYYDYTERLFLIKGKSKGWYYYNWAEYDNSWTKIFSSKKKIERLTPIVNDVFKLMGVLCKLEHQRDNEKEQQINNEKLTILPVTNEDLDFLLNM